VLGRHSNDSSSTRFRDQRREGEPPVLVLPSPIFQVLRVHPLQKIKNLSVKRLRSIDLFSYVMCFWQGTPVILSVNSFASDFRAKRILILVVHSYQDSGVGKQYCSVVIHSTFYYFIYPLSESQIAPEADNYLKLSTVTWSNII